MSGFNGSNGIPDSHLLSLGLGACGGVVVFACALLLFKFRSVFLADDDLQRHREWMAMRSNTTGTEDSLDASATIIPCGIDKSDLEKIPTFVMSAADAQKEEVECSVCLEVFLKGETGRVLPKCRHCFHVECIDMWLYSHSSCPVCRCQIVLSERKETTIDISLLSQFGQHESDEGALVSLQTDVAAIQSPRLQNNAINIQPSVESSIPTPIMGVGQSPVPVDFPSGSILRQVDDVTGSSGFWDYHVQQAVNTVHFSSRLPSLIREPAIVPDDDHRTRFLTVDIRSDCS